MKRNTVFSIGMIVLMAAAAGCGQIMQDANAGSGTRLAFACYSDGIVIEAWDDLKDIERGDIRGDTSWTITTQAGDRGVFLQTQGTSCWPLRLQRNEVIGDDMSSREGITNERP